MSVFTYQAVRRNGERLNGEVEAPSRAEACRKLELQDLQPVSLQLKEAVVRADSAPSVALSRDEPLLLTRAQIILFTEELSDLLEAGLQLEPALRIMEQREESSSLKAVTAALRQQVREGVSFSSALRSVSASFSELYCNLVTAGEVSGALPQILRRQAAYLNTMAELQSRVVDALIYPAFIVGAGILLLCVFMIKLVPQLTVLFTKTGKTLPLITRALISVSAFLGHYWWAILGGALVGGVIFWRVIQNEEGRLWWDRVRLKIPLVGGVLMARFYAQLSQTLSTLVRNGVPLLSGLRLLTAGTPNLYLRRLLERVVEIVAEGGALSRALKRVEAFPPVLIDLLAVGEQTGDLGAALEKAARRYDKELGQRIQRITTLIQPVVIVGMAMVVGVVAYAIITGIFQGVSGLRIHR